MHFKFSSFSQQVCIPANINGFSSSSARCCSWGNAIPYAESLGGGLRRPSRCKPHHMLTAKTANTRLHQKRDGQQGDRGGYSSLLSLHKAPYGALHTGQGPPVQEQHRAVGGGPEEAMKTIRGQEQLSCDKRLRELGLFSLTKGLQGDHAEASCSAPSELISFRETNFLHRQITVCRGGEGGTFRRSAFLGGR